MPPFSFPSPVATIDEVPAGVQHDYPDKKLCLWELASLPAGSRTAYPSPMSEIVATPPRRVWLNLATTGVVLVVIAMVVVALVLIDKPHFGFLVGTTFVQVITSGVMIGAALTLVGVWKLPQRRAWPGIALIVWSLIALTSPAFGFLFLLPWSILALALPVIIVALVGLYRP